MTKTPTEYTEFVEVVCGNHMMQELGNNNCSFLSLLSELIDNVAAELNHCKVANVEIIIGGEWIKNSDGKRMLDLSNAFIEVRDDATGIARDDIGKCLSLAVKHGDDLHEHGVGLKTAVVSLGTLEYIRTRSKLDPVATKITDLKIGKIPIYDDPDFVGFGTHIRIKSLKPKVYRRKE